MWNICKQIWNICKKISNICKKIRIICKNIWNICKKIQNIWKKIQNYICKLFWNIFIAFWKAEIAKSESQFKKLIFEMSTIKFNPIFFSDFLFSCLSLKLLSDVLSFCLQWLWSIRRVWCDLFGSDGSDQFEESDAIFLACDRFMISNLIRSFCLSIADIS